MKKNKRFLSILMTLTMILSMTVMFPCTASAYTTGEQDAIAKALKNMNLFEGYSATDFGLNDVPTREQALIFQIRALGEDGAAKAWTGPSPYTDVPGNHWALPYIGYATKMGYTTGTGSGQFGLNQPADAQMMITFMLRGMGYTDGGAAPDFTYANSLTVGKAKKMIESDVPPARFTRGDAASILFDSLGVPVKGNSEVLASKLMNKGVFTQKQFDDSMNMLINYKPTQPVTPPTPPVQPTPPPVPNNNQNMTTEKGPANGTYTIKKMNTNQVWDVSQASTGDGANLIIYQGSRQANQQFAITKVGNYYSIKAKHSGKAVTVPTPAGNGTVLVQGTYTGADNQLFKITIDSKGKALIMAKNGYYVGASGGSNKNGTPLILWTRATDGSQAFQLQNVATTQPTVTDKEITFVNKTGQTLTAFYASSSAEDDWGENLLDRSLANGKSVTIIFPVAKDDKVFDVRTDYKNTYFEFNKIDFSKFKTKGEKVVLTIKNGEGIMTQQ